MPINYLRYHPDWKDIIRPKVLKKANYRCQVCGVPNRMVVLFNPDGSWIEVDDVVKKHIENTDEKPVRAILTVAHLNHLVIDNRDENLRAMCQIHHLAHDRSHKADMKRFAKLANFEAVQIALQDPEAVKWLPQVFALIRARRNQYLHLTDQVARRSWVKGKDHYAKELKRLADMYQDQFEYLLNWAAGVLADHYQHPDPLDFYDRFYRSETRLIGELKPTS